MALGGSNSSSFKYTTTTRQGPRPPTGLLSYGEGRREGVSSSGFRLGVRDRDDAGTPDEELLTVKRKRREGRRRRGGWGGERESERDSARANKVDDGPCCQKEKRKGKPSKAEGVYLIILPLHNNRDPP